MYQCYMSLFCVSCYSNIFFPDKLKCLQGFRLLSLVDQNDFLEFWATYWHIYCCWWRSNRHICVISHTNFKWLRQLHKISETNLRDCGFHWMEIFQHLINSGKCWLCFICLCLIRNHLNTCHVYVCLGITIILVTFMFAQEFDVFYLCI